MAELFRQLRTVIGVRLGHDEHEFLTAVSPEGIGRADRLLDRLGDPAQDDVAESVPVRVVDGLEVIDVEECDRQGTAVATGSIGLGEEIREQSLAARQL